MDKLDAVERDLNSLQLQGASSELRQSIETQMLTLVSKRDKIIDALRKACNIKKLELDIAIQECKEEKVNFNEIVDNDDDALDAVEVKFEGHR